MGVFFEISRHEKKKINVNWCWEYEYNKQGAHGGQ